MAEFELMNLFDLRVTGHTIVDCNGDVVATAQNQAAALELAELITEGAYALHRQRIEKLFEDRVTMANDRAEAFTKSLIAGMDESSDVADWEKNNPPAESRVRYCNSTGIRYE